MLPALALLRRRLDMTLTDKTEQGHITDGLRDELRGLPDSYDRLMDFARRLADLPLRDDWPYVEPNDRDAIEAELAPDRPRGPMTALDAKETAARVETAFFSSVCGCMVGKPLEVPPTLAEVRTALEAIGEWPLRDYISERLDLRGRRDLHVTWPQTTRERLRYAAPDDDINYTVLGMLILEEYGLNFTHDQMRRLWLTHIPPYQAFGPERLFVVRAGMSVNDAETQNEAFYHELVTVCNPEDEHCGAMIRADAYGYASAGNPEQAARLAGRDACLTHQRTGIYGAMFAAAAIAAAPALRDPLAVFEIALKFTPQRSRFYRIVSDALNEVGAATDWLDGYARIHDKYGEYGHCRIYQEAGTLINTLRFAENIGDGFCKQVSQGNDTDSYGATSGSILGMFFGAGHLETRWLTPLNDTIYTTLAGFHEQSLSRLALRMGELPARFAKSTADAALN